jgi:uncharacterized protein (TIGR03437 family)
MTHFRLGLQDTSRPTSAGLNSSACFERPFVSRMSHIKLLLLLILVLAPLKAQTQIGGGTCSNSTINGAYFYLLSGEVLSNGSTDAYAELGMLTADGNGNITGQSRASLGGALGTYSLSGTYTVQGNCSGTIMLSVDSQTPTPVMFQIVNGGEGMVVAFSESNEVIIGRAYRQSAQSGNACSTASLSGSYGYLLSGVTSAYGGSLLFSEAGSVVSDGAGGLTAIGFANAGGTTAMVTGTGSYTVSSDCSGTVQVNDSNGSTNYVIAIAEDGSVILFMQTDAGWAVGGTAQPQFAAPQQAIVNAASYQPRQMAPGSLFSIFGSGFSNQTASAASVPLPNTLASTQVLINGEPAPILYVSPSQINAEVPLDIPTGQPVSLAVVNQTTSSNAAAVTVSPTAPGIFTYGQNWAVVQNPDGSINSEANPAHSSDILVAYLTGGGAVSPAGPWTTGGPAPNGSSPVTSPYSITVGGQQTQQYYLGLTPAFVGLYQANFKVPQLAPGSYPLYLTVAGSQSNAAMIAIAP